MQHRLSRFVATVLVLAAAQACKKETPPPAPTPPKPAAIAAPASAPAAAPAPAPAAAPAKAAPAAPTVTDPQWIAGLPTRAVNAKAGDTVFCVIPKKGTEFSDLSLCTVESVSGTTATVLKQPMGEKVVDLPGVLIYPIPATTLKVGDVALGITIYGAFHGRIARVEGGKTSMKILWVNDTKELETKAAMTPPTGLAPLAWVHYKNQSMVTTRYLGLLIAMDEQKAWILSGTVAVTNRSDVAPAQLQPEYKVGQKVLIDFPGLQQATISKIVTPGLTYKATLPFMGKPMEKLLAFPRILEKL